MLIGHRFERTAQGDLHIHSHNHAQSIAIVMAGALSVALPVAFVLFGIATGIPGEMHPLHLLLIILAMLLIAALAVLMAVYTDTRETLLLSRHGGEGKRRTQNFFGRRERVVAFKTKGPKRLELRRRPHAEPIYTQLWLVMRDGPEHRLTTDTVPVVPGSKRTEVWLRELAEYLEVPVPTEVIETPAAGPVAAYQPAPVLARHGTAKRTRHKDNGPTAALEPTDKIGIPGRLLLSLIGAFLAVLELTQVIALVRALFTGRLRFSGIRSGSSSFYWADQPLTFSFNVLVGVAEVLIIGLIAWSCLRVAVQGRMKRDG
jgi:membrane protein implicated in regulation of membrane protease activity